LKVAVAALAAVLATPVRAQSSSSVENAMQDELQRSVHQLNESGYPSIYYASLNVTDLVSWEEVCQMGGRSSLTRYSRRLAVPDVRVGGYEFDNHPLTPPPELVGQDVAVSKDAFSLRHSFWLLFDDSYKGAVGDYLRKQADRVVRGKAEYDTDDLSRESIRVFQGIPTPAPWSDESLDKLCVAASGVFRQQPHLLEAQADVEGIHSWSMLRDSEGSRVDHGSDAAYLELTAVDVSTDGTKLFSFRRFTVTAPEHLPTLAQIQDAAQDMLDDLKSLKVAQTTSPFSAPALIDPSISASVLLSMASLMTGEERRDPNGAQTFRGLMDRRVLPPSLTLIDDPTISEYMGLPLAGHYDFDNQGVAPQKVVLVDQGVLKGLLLSRYPSIGFMHSNGHGRATAGFYPRGFPGSLFLTSQKPLSEAQMLKKLRELCRKRGKPFGLWVKKLRHVVQEQQAEQKSSIRIMPELLYLVDTKTGSLTLVRDLDLVETPLALISNILEAGKDMTTQNLLWDDLPVSVAVPSLLLSEAELQRSENAPKKPPILPPPPVQ
jgi:hypothetical protein